MFGVKSTAMSALAHHPRLASVDSMAWDFAARCDRRTGRDMDFRIQHMHRWAQSQAAIASAAELRAPLNRADIGLDLPGQSGQACLFPTAGQTCCSLAIPNTATPCRVPIATPAYCCSEFGILEW